jgi:hypothetical protein
MKRYLIFVAIGPLIGGFLLLFATTYQSGYWTETNAKTLQYSYLFGIVPSLMLGAVDDILFHLPKIRPVLRTLIVGALGFVAAELLYGSRGPDSGVVQFLLYGLVGLAPATISSWLSHKYVDERQALAS